MIHFDSRLCEKALETVKEAHDCADVLNDLTLVNNTLSQARNISWYEYARRLDDYLRKKYPLIEEMLNAADAFLPQPTATHRTGQEKSVEALRLEQDYYGILCDTAMKKALVKEIKDFIAKVD